MGASDQTKICDVARVSQPGQPRIGIVLVDPEVSDKNADLALQQGNYATLTTATPDKKF